MKFRFKRLVMRAWSAIPWGNLCVFWYGKQRVTLTKTGWVIIDAGKGTVTDALPVTMVSQKLIDEIERQLKQRGYTA